MFLMNTLQLILSILIPGIIGLGAAHLLFRKRALSRIFLFSISFCLGLGFLTSWMIVLSMVQIPWSVELINYPLLFLSILINLYLIKTNSTRRKEERGIKQITSTNQKTLTSIIYALILGYIFYQILFTFWKALSFPLYTWDEIFIIAIKAKVFYFSQSLEKINLLPLPSYPLHVPLSMSWVALNLGNWHEQFVKIIFPFIFLSILGIHFTFLRQKTSRFWATLGIALLVSSNFFVYHASIAYQEMPLIAYNLSIPLLFLLAQREKEDGFLILAGLFAGFSTHTKLEALGYVALNSFLLIYLLTTQDKNPFFIKIKRFLKFIIPAGIIYLLYVCTRIHYQIPTAEDRFICDFTANSFSRIPIIFSTMIENIFFSGNWNILWLLLLASFLKNQKKLATCFETRLLTLALCSYFLLYFAISFLTPNFASISGPESPTVLSRVILHFFPLVPLLIVLLNSPGGIES